MKHPSDRGHFSLSIKFRELALRWVSQCLQVAREWWWLNYSSNAHSKIIITPIDLALTFNRTLSKLCFSQMWCAPVLSTDQLKSDPSIVALHNLLRLHNTLPITALIPVPNYHRNPTPLSPNYPACLNHHSAPPHPRYRTPRHYHTVSRRGRHLSKPMTSFHVIHARERAGLGERGGVRGSGRGFRLDSFSLFTGLLESLRRPSPSVWLWGEMHLPYTL